MSGFYFLFPAWLAVLISFLIVRAASIALMMTGLDRNKSRFQALSAFSGTGFTTKESEAIVNHPRRRRIVRWLMLMGNAGIVTVIVAATSNMVSRRGFQLPINVLVFLVGIFLIFKLAKVRGFAREWDRFIERKLLESSVFDESTVEDLLHFRKGYGLVKEIILEKSPLVGKSRMEAKLNEKGVLVLGIERENVWIPGR